MNDEQLLRYSRQILLPAVGIEGQEKLLRSRALVVGAGGLGSPVAMYLGASGIGTLVIADGDKVELSNLQRQIAHTTPAIGRLKVDSAAQTLAALNPEVTVHRIAERLEGERLRAEVARADVVIDGSDNFATRFAVNAACVAVRTPLVFGAVIRTEGQVSVFNPGIAESPCYRCLYPEGEEINETCSQTGVLAPVPGIIGAIQATEAIKVLLNSAGTLVGRLLLLDAATMEWRSVRLRKDPRCPVCAAGA